ncbi:MAG: CRISPR-associated endoribonuclease Cas6 [Potamolinea sp.]
MPHSLILNLVPVSPIYPQFLTGRHFHALFCTLVSHVDQELGDRLHSEKTEKAFTLSPLQVSSFTSNVPPHQRGIRGVHGGKGGFKNHFLQWEHSQAIPAGTLCWWRISLLDDALFGKLTELWLNLNPQHPWHLGPADLHITSILGTPQSTQPWAHACSYAQLYEQASESDRVFSFSFATPAAFRQGHYDTALPTRDCIFNGLLKRWNKYSGLEFYEIAIESIFPSFFNIRTEIVADSRSKFIGCVGEVSYRLMGDLEPLQIKMVNALADFALYAGVGRKTPMGLGMVRRLINS